MKLSKDYESIKSLDDTVILKELNGQKQLSNSFVFQRESNFKLRKDSHLNQNINDTLRK